MTGAAFDEAWVEIRLTTHPDERHFALAHDVLTQVLLARSGVSWEEGLRYGPEAGTRCVPETGPRYAPRGEWRPRDGSLRP